MAAGRTNTCETPGGCPSGDCLGVNPQPLCYLSRGKQSIRTVVRVLSKGQRHHGFGTDIRGSVSAVVFKGLQAEVSRVETEAILAPVIHRHAVRDRANEQKVGNPVCGGRPDHTIPVRVFAATPSPTGSDRVDLHELGEVRKYRHVNYRIIRKGAPSSISASEPNVRFDSFCGFRPFCEVYGFYGLRYDLRRMSRSPRFVPLGRSPWATWRGIFAILDLGKYDRLAS